MMRMGSAINDLGSAKPAARSPIIATIAGPTQRPDFDGEVADRRLVIISDMLEFEPAKGGYKHVAGVDFLKPTNARHLPRKPRLSSRTCRSSSTICNAKIRRAFKPMHIAASGACGSQRPARATWRYSAFAMHSLQTKTLKFQNHKKPRAIKGRSSCSGSFCFLSSASPALRWQSALRLCNWPFLWRAAYGNWPRLPFGLQRNGRNVSARIGLSSVSGQ